MKALGVTVDQRETRTSSLWNILREMEGVKVTIRQLDLGDYAWDSGVVFERKTMPDLVYSIKTDRLFQQAIRLSSSARRVALIVEGRAEASALQGIGSARLKGALLCVAVKLGVPVVRSGSPEESAELMRMAARQLHDAPRRTRHFRFRGPYPARRKRMQLQMLQVIPGLGPERACRLLDEFKTLKDIFDANPEELSRVSGIGPRLIAQIQSLVL